VDTSFREETSWGKDEGGTGWATFDRDLREQLQRSEKPALDAFEGQVWHEPLPLEFAREEAPLADLLGQALAAAGVETQPGEAGSRVATRLLYAPRAVLAVLVNETAADTRRRLEVGGRSWHVPVAAGRARLVLFERGSGEVLVVTPGESVVAVP
jgi:hypothetical protein